MNLFRGVTVMPGAIHNYWLGIMALAFVIAIVAWISLVFYADRHPVRRARGPEAGPPVPERGTEPAVPEPRRATDAEPAYQNRTDMNSPT